MEANLVSNILQNTIEIYFIASSQDKIAINEFCQIPTRNILWSQINSKLISSILPNSNNICVVASNWVKIDIKNFAEL